MQFSKIDPLPHFPPYGSDLMISLGLKGLHCGSGANLKAACLNTDSMTLADQRGHTTKAGTICLVDDSFFYLQYDATKPFPIGNQAFYWIYSEHFIEHIPQQVAVAWFKEMRRLLLPTGTMRVSTPDLEKYIRGYLDPESKFFKEHIQRLNGMGVQNVPNRPAWLVNQIFRLWGHQHIYDFEELKFTAGLAGFPTERARKCEFRSGSLPELAELDREIRNDESLYVEIPL
jgi:predicted SAM-dependent methyltransferase